MRNSIIPQYITAKKNVILAGTTLYYTINQFHGYKLSNINVCPLNKIMSLERNNGYVTQYFTKVKRFFIRGIGLERINSVPILEIIKPIVRVYTILLCLTYYHWHYCGSLSFKMVCIFTVFPYTLWDLMLQKYTIFPFFLPEWNATFNIACMYFYSTTHCVTMTSKENFIIWFHFTSKRIYNCVCSIVEKIYLQIPLIYKRKCVWIFIVMLHARL